MKRSELISLIKECIQEIAPMHPPVSRVDEMITAALRNLYKTTPEVKELLNKKGKLTVSELETIQQWAQEKLKPIKNGVLINFKTGKLNHNLKDNYVLDPDTEADVYVYYSPREGLETIQDAIDDLTPVMEKKPLFVFWLSPEYVANAVLGKDIANRIVVPGYNHPL